MRFSPGCRNKLKKNTTQGTGLKAFQASVDDQKLLEDAHSVIFLMKVVLLRTWED